jgi:hypothetical protein
VIGVFLLTSCTVAKLEARLEANPQCKEVINPKTGTSMPCPGSDKAFYRAAGIEPARSSPAKIEPVSQSYVSPDVPLPNQPLQITPKATPVPSSPSSECKPQIHKKSGGMIPCPAIDL